MTLEIKTNGDAAYKRGFNDKEVLVTKLYESLNEYQKNPNNGLYRYIFGKVFSNITACDRLGKKSKSLKVYPHRLNGQQVRYLKRALKLSEEIKVPLAEIIGVCAHVGEIASVPPNTIIAFADVLKQLDKAHDKPISDESHYRLEVLRVHIEGIKDVDVC